MLLRRLMQHVRDQNWFAVGLDFVIVVLGIFIGFQVSGWSDQREAQSAADDLIARLYAEVIDVEEARAAWYGQPDIRERARFSFDTLQLLWSASDLIYRDDAPDRALTVEECSAIIQSHIMNTPPLALPVLQELESTGGIRLIRDEALRAALINLRQQITRSQTLIAGVNIDAANISSQFPDVVSFQAPDGPMRGWDPIFSGTAVCDVEAMRTNPVFRNRFADNISRYNAYMDATRTQQGLRLAELRAALEAALGLPGSDDGEEFAQ